MKKLILITSLVITSLPLLGQSKEKLENRASLVLGTSQLLIGGFNIEGNLFWKRLAFDYSHGVSLDLDNSLLTGSAKEQGLAVHLPFSTGFGIGYRFSNAFNIRLEPKWHKFEIYYEGEAQTESNLIDDYTTFTLGLGAYYTWLPFKKKDNFLKGFTVVPSLRWWPKIADNQTESLIYDNKITGREEAHDVLNIGLNNTPWILNISIGYSLNLRIKPQTP